MRKWKKFAEDHGSPYVHGICYLKGALRLKEILGISNDTLLLDMRDTHWYFCAAIEGGEAKWDRLGKEILKMLEEPAFLRKTYEGQVSSARAVRDFSQKLRETDLKKIPDMQLCDLYDSLIEKWEWMNAWGDIVNLSDFGHFLLTDRIMKFLEEKIEESDCDISAGEAFGILGTPLERSFMQQQEVDFYGILEKIQKSPEAKRVFSGELDAIIPKLNKLPMISKMLEEQVRKYDWINFHYDGPDLADDRFFCDLLRSELKQGADGRRKKEVLLRHSAEIKDKQAEIGKKLHFLKEHNHWALVARSFSYLKGLRKDTVFIGSRNSDGLLREFAFRLSLSPKQVRHASNIELREWLNNGSANVPLLNSRIKHNVILPFDDGIRILDGAEAEKYSKLVVFEEVSADLKELKGTPAYPGHASGIVKIIGKAGDMPKMNKGDILVSMATNPNIVPAMKKAAAIITDEGGVTCHAAIVSREMKIPCVIGTKIATKALKDGDLVDVDATKGLIRKK